MEIEKELEQILSDDIYKAVISKPDKKRAAYRRLEIPKRRRSMKIWKKRRWRIWPGSIWAWIFFR